MDERVFIIIDGSNFYHRLKELKLTNLLDFDYERFTQFLIGKRSLVLKKYYIGAIRAEIGNLKSQKLWRNQRILLGKLQRQGWKIGFGHMLKTDKYHEKGVDVLMAVDLLVGAYENIYDTTILVSSDTDLIPAIKKARSMKKKIEYIGLSHKPSYALIANSDVRRLLIEDELLKCFKEAK
ncbi:MAG: NYN domain-containing protein [Minisyncoccales bacterium]